MSSREKPGAFHEHPSIRHPFKSLFAALRFLTILPLGSSEEDHLFFDGALFYFSFVGMLIGIAGYLFASILSGFMPAMVLSTVMALYLSLSSGFLHLDGLADTSDGFLSSRPKEQCLEIMRDSSIGVMGAAALIFVLLLKSVSLGALHKNELGPALVICATGGRSALVLMMAVLPYARQDGGLGQLFYTRGVRIGAAVSLVVFMVTVLFFVPQKLILLLFILLTVTVLFCWLCHYKIGGATGDTLGAMCELSETAILIFLCSRL